MSRQAASSIRREGGTASVETVAVVPFLLLAVLVAAQLGLAGWALWSAGVAARAGARAGARAALVEGGVEASARQALPASMRSAADVDAAAAVSVRVVVPRLLPMLPPLKVGAKAALEPGDG
jgi:Flp pilus assembly protein TadG